MPSEVLIYHNPRCSKSRATLELLEANGIKPRIVEYLKEPPTPSMLTHILDLLGLEPRELMRRHEDEYQAAHLDDPGLSRDTLIQAMTQHPRLIERPIVIVDGRAAIGRPPENVLEIIHT